MKKIVFLFALFITFTSFSQDAAKAKALLNEVSAKVKSYKIKNIYKKCKQNF